MKSVGFCLKHFSCKAWWTLVCSDPWSLSSKFSSEEAMASHVVYDEEDQEQGPSRYHAVDSGYGGTVVTGWATWFRRFPPAVVVSRAVFLAKTRAGALASSLVTFLSELMIQVAERARGEVADTWERSKIRVWRSVSLALAQAKNLASRLKSTRKSVGTQTSEPTWRAIEKTFPGRPRPIRVVEETRMLVAAGPPMPPPPKRWAEGSSSKASPSKAPPAVKSRLERLGRSRSPPRVFAPRAPPSDAADAGIEVGAGGGVEQHSEAMLA